VHDQLMQCRFLVYLLPIIYDEVDTLIPPYRPSCKNVLRFFYSSTLNEKNHVLDVIYFTTKVFFPYTTANKIIQINDDRKMETEKCHLLSLNYTKFICCKVFMSMNARWCHRRY